MSDRVPVTIYSRADCSLCDKALASVRAAESLYRLNLDIHEVDIDADPSLKEKFDHDVPVIHIRGKEAFRHSVDPRELATIVRGAARPATTLASETCVPCHGGVAPLAGEELQALLRELGGGWRLTAEHHITKEFKFPDFAQALSFTNRIGAIAEEQGHHPDIQLGWGRVAVDIWTHAINGLSRSDFVLAARIDADMAGK